MIEAVGRRHYRALVGAGLLLAGLLVLPDAALAHGLSGRSDPPIPGWLFAWGAAIVLAVSFFAFALLWREPILEHAIERPVIRVPQIVEVACGVVGVVVFVAVLYAGFAGSQVASDNILPTFTYVLFWAALPFLCALFGNFFAAFNPWRAVGRFCGWAVSGISGKELPPTFEYPDQLGRWPAVAGILAFGWLELVSTAGSDPSFIALMALIYALIQLTGMSLFGVAHWTERGDGFAGYFDLFGRMAPLTVKNGQLLSRKFLAGLSELHSHAGTVALICTGIGVTAFDGLAEGPLWAGMDRHIESVLSGAGFSSRPALQISYTLGMLLCVAAVVGIYRLGVAGMNGIGSGMTTAQLSRTFAPSLVPIILAYVVAHYLSLVLFQGQALYALVSDPLGNGSDFFGGAGFVVHYTLVSGQIIWYAQVAALVLGHVLALAVAHDKALAVFGKARTAVTSQYWMLVVMIGFTTLGLWLLSVSNS
ncbi:MAG: hypothetical protein JHC87_00515 [Thermoleophilaceae bacterium]|nr:hypothetical protein [Thermoleophilaceae bacterium]